MPVIRISLVEPLPGREKEIEALYDELGKYHSTMEGHILGCRVQPVGREYLRGRVSIWRSLEDANHAASQTHTAALRSQIRFAAASDEERLYEVQGTLWGLEKLK